MIKCNATRCGHKSWATALLIVAIMGVVALGSSRAQAQARTVCFAIGIAEDREGCPGRFHPPEGGRFVCDGSGAGLRVELWDADTGSDPDDLIVTALVAAAGQSCVTFNWTDAADAPDVYIRIIPSARGSLSGPIAWARRNDGTVSTPNWANYPAAWTRTWGQVNNCAAGATCTILPGQTILPDGNPATDVSQAYMALQSASRSLQVFNSAISNTSEIILQIDERERWADPPTVPDALFPGRIRLPLGLIARSGDVVAHEMGHIFHTREFNNGFTGSVCGSGWNNNIRSSDACATREGFAMYISAATWYDPAIAGAKPFYDGYSIERPQPDDDTSCFANHDIPGQVAKAFWDLDDVNNELSVGVAAGVQDNQNLPSTTILNLWSNLPNGAQNGGNDEPGPEGMNLMDYWFEALQFTAPGAFDTLIFQNCLDDQTQ